MMTLEDGVVAVTATVSFSTLSSKGSPPSLRGRFATFVLSDRVVVTHVWPPFVLLNTPVVR